MDICVRQERKEDYGAVYKLVKAAFTGMEYSEGNEQDLVVRLRESDGFLPALSLVAEEDGNIVGHILFSEIQIGKADSLMLAPVAVLPAYQRRGIGGMLIREGHRIAKEKGFTSSTLVGHPDYYPRFGYKRASTWGITLNIPAPDECFMAMELVPGALEHVSGMIVLPPAFGL